MYGRSGWKELPDRSVVGRLAGGAETETQRIFGEESNRRRDGGENVVSKDEKSEKEKRVKEYLEEYDRVNRPESLASIYKRVGVESGCNVDEGGREGGSDQRRVFA